VAVEVASARTSVEVIVCLRSAYTQSQSRYRKSGNQFVFHAYFSLMIKKPNRTEDPAV